MCCKKQMVPTRQAVGEMETLAGDITAEDLARLDPSSVLCIRTRGKKWGGEWGSVLALEARLHTCFLQAPRA